MLCDQPFYKLHFLNWAVHESRCALSRSFCCSVAERVCHFVDHDLWTLEKKKKKDFGKPWRKIRQREKNRNFGEVLLHDVWSGWRSSPGELNQQAAAAILWIVFVCFFWVPSLKTNEKKKTTEAEPKSPASKDKADALQAPTMFSSKKWTEQVQRPPPFESRKGRGSCRGPGRWRREAGIFLALVRENSTKCEQSNRAKSGKSGGCMTSFCCAFDRISHVPAPDSATKRQMSSSTTFPTVPTSGVPLSQRLRQRLATTIAEQEKQVEAWQSYQVVKWVQVSQLPGCVWLCCARPCQPKPRSRS